MSIGSSYKADAKVEQAVKGGGEWCLFNNVNEISVTEADSDTWQCCDNM